MSAPWSMRCIAVSKFLLSSAFKSGVTPSGLGWFTSAPASTIATAQAWQPERVA